MITFFRYVALVEGITTLALFLIAMPLKYGFGNPILVPPVGLIHGIAFLIYVLVMLLALRRRGFSAREWMRTALAAFVPFGTFLNDPMLKRKQAILAASAARHEAQAAPGQA
jgi:integral membrane protein